MTTQMKTRIFYILFLASSFISVHGQAIENNQIMVRADSVIQLGKNYRISYQYNYKDSLDEITTPQWNWGSSDYEVLTGPSTSSQTSHSTLSPRTISFLFILASTTRSFPLGAMLSEDVPASLSIGSDITLTEKDLEVTVSPLANTAVIGGNVNSPVLKNFNMNV